MSAETRRAEPTDESPRPGTLGLPKHDRLPVLSKNDRFDGDFDLLPFAACCEFGPVPQYPTDSEFQLAAMQADDSPAARWQCEAIRFRRIHPAAPLTQENLRKIASRVAARLHALAVSS